MRTHTTWLERETEDELLEIEVEFTLEGGSPESGMSGSPEHYDPGSAPELCIVSTVGPYGEAVTLTDEEVAKVWEDVMGRIGDF